MLKQSASKCRVIITSALVSAASSSNRILGSENQNVSKSKATTSNPKWRRTWMMAWRCKMEPLWGSPNPPSKGSQQETVEAAWLRPETAISQAFLQASPIATKMQWKFSWVIQNTNFPTNFAQFSPQTNETPMTFRSGFGRRQEGTPSSGTLGSLGTQRQPLVRQVSSVMPEWPHSRVVFLVMAITTDSTASSVEWKMGLSFEKSCLLTRPTHWSGHRETSSSTRAQPSASRPKGASSGVRNRRSP
mmetsp:Transcript_66458/g.144300  ORF Transcript_66458/g.144300 Transcript_66458/m.144300 type:complete len:246 (-) Transcript_66458:1227-1964(-)